MLSVRRHVILQGKPMLVRKKTYGLASEAKKTKINAGIKKLEKYMKKNITEELFQRYDGNPIIKAQDMPYPAYSEFNEGAVYRNEETILLMSVEDKRGISHLTVVRSRDGFTNWIIDEKPTIQSDPKNYPEEIWGIEDPRITYLEEQQVFIQHIRRPDRWFL